MASAEASTPPAAAAGATPNPSEVGWQFVPQYYTFVNKHPNRLHCFYTKASTFIHGTEGDESVTCHGQQEIHNQITAIGFQDCKVFIDCVDAQASANGGIVVQVIGEMSNKGEPWRKFVQTFFLAEQPGGYYVLNDIFRFLKEDSVDEDGAAQEGAPDAEVPPSEAPIVSVPASAQPASAEQEPIPVSSTEAKAEPELEPTPEPEPEPEPAAAEPESEAPKVNGHAEPEVEVEPPVEEVTPPSPLPEDEGPVDTAEPVSAPPAASPSPQPTAPAAPSPAAAQNPPPAAAPATPAAPAAPAAPKTWANLAATNSKKWGTAVATESRGTSEAPPPAPPSAQRPPQAAPGGAGRGFAPPPRTPGGGEKNDHPLFQAVMALTTPQCFVKGVIEPVSNNQLNQVLTQRFGPIKELEVVRSKACAFLEFTTLEAAKRAIVASLPGMAGGEGGIRIDCGDGAVARITVETRKERGERPISRPRGGGPPTGDRGSFRGRGGGSMRGRGGPPPPAVAAAAK